MLAIYNLSSLRLESQNMNLLLARPIHSLNKDWPNPARYCNYSCLHSKDSSYLNDKRLCRITTPNPQTFPPPMPTKLWLPCSARALGSNTKDQCGPPRVGVPTRSSHGWGHRSLDVTHTWTRRSTDTRWCMPTTLPVASHSTFSRISCCTTSSHSTVLKNMDISSIMVPDHILSCVNQHTTQNIKCNLIIFNPWFVS